MRNMRRRLLDVFTHARALTTLRLADDDVTENGDNHQRICRNLSKCKFTVNLYLILDLYIRQITMARVKHINAYI